MLLFILLLLLFLLFGGLGFAAHLLWIGLVVIFVLFLLGAVTNRFWW